MKVQAKHANIYYLLCLGALSGLGKHVLRRWVHWLNIKLNAIIDFFSLVITWHLMGDVHPQKVHKMENFLTFFTCAFRQCQSFQFVLYFHSQFFQFSAGFWLKLLPLSFYVCVNEWMYLQITQFVWFYSVFCYSCKKRISSSSWFVFLLPTIWLNI